MRKLTLTLTLVMLTVSVCATRPERQLRSLADRQLRAMGITAPSEKLAERTACAIYGVPSGGFVVVNKTDVGEQVLGYSEKVYDGGTLPCGFAWWLDAIDHMLQQGVVRKVQQSYAAVDDFLTTEWGQGSPYNDKCPIDGGAHCQAGCAAISLAQVMRYYGWPAQGQGTGGYYLGLTQSSTYVSEPVNGVYEWEKLNHVNFYNADADAKAAVAVLVFDCGKAATTYYTRNTSASIDSNQAVALTRNFMYNPQTVRYVERKDYSDEQWMTMVYSELQARRPLFYSGYAENGYLGHAFLISGMDEEGRVYVNWGWDGRYNGFFALDAIKLTMTLDFRYDQTMILGVMPAGTTPSGVCPPATADDEAAPCYYDLIGRRTDGTVRGLTIVRKGGKVQKVIN